MKVSLRIILSLLSGVLLVLSFPPFDLPLLAWIALVPLFLALQGTKGRVSFALGYSTGIVFMIGVFYWITIPPAVLLIDFLLLGIYLWLYFGVFATAFNLLSQKPLLPLFLTVPAIWVSLEYARTHFFFLEFPMGLLSHTQHDHLALIQIASLTGAYGVSFLIVMVNVAIFEVMRDRPRALAPVLCTLSLVGCSLAYGSSLLSPSSASFPTRSLAVTVVHGNVPEDVRWDPAFSTRVLAHHSQLTRRAMEAGPSDLVVWPESSVPGGLHRQAYTRKKLSDLAREVDTYLLVGHSERAKFGQHASPDQNLSNTASLLSPAGRTVQHYQKMKLLSFGEYLPLRDYLPWPSRYASRMVNVVPGKDMTVFRLFDSKGRRASFSVLICWDAVFPDFVRQFVERGAKFLVVIANEAWVAGSAAPYQFLPINVFRAVENRRAVVRSVNGGISGFIDPYGRILRTVKEDMNGDFVPGFLTYDIPLVREYTFYTVYGDVFAKSVVLVSVLLLLLSALQRSRRTLVAAVCR